MVPPRNNLKIIEGAFKREDENGIKNKLSFVYVVKSRKISFITSASFITLLKCSQYHY